MKQILSSLAAGAIWLGMASAAPVVVTLEGSLISAPGSADPVVEATLVFDDSGSPLCSPLAATFPEAATGTAFYPDALVSLTIDIGPFSWNSLGSAVTVGNDTPIFGSDDGLVDGVSFGSGPAALSIFGFPLFGFFGTSGITFLDADASVLSSLLLADIDLTEAAFEIQDTIIYSLGFFGPQTLTIEWDAESLEVVMDDPISTPVPMSAWLMFGPLAGWAISRRRWTSPS